jgi:hypothetical protein
MWGTPKEIETRRRILVSIWAYAYEIASPPRSLVSDFTFDHACRSVAANLAIDTNRADLDHWFRNAFCPTTGLWIHAHPELDKIKQLFERIYLHDK